MLFCTMYDVGSVNTAHVLWSRFPHQTDRQSKTDKKLSWDLLLFEADFKRSFFQNTTLKLPIPGPAPATSATPRAAILYHVLTLERLSLSFQISSRHIVSFSKKNTRKRQMNVTQKFAAGCHRQVVDRMQKTEAKA